MDDVREVPVHVGKYGGWNYGSGNPQCLCLVQCGYRDGDQDERVTDVTDGPHERSDLEREAVYFGRRGGRRPRGVDDRHEVLPTGPVQPIPSARSGSYRLRSATVGSGVITKDVRRVPLGMVTITLDDRDRAILARLREGDADVDSLAESVDCSRSYVRDRLPELADNGLVLRVHSDVYTITANGKRTIAGSPAGTMDERIDTPASVERRIASFDLRPDRAEAVRNAFAFLQYWGSAIEAEIIDGVYSENPAGYASPDDWWSECVRDRLADLPLVEPTQSDAGEWRYTETPTVDQPTSDGRSAPDEDATAGTSVKYALEHSGLDDDELAAVRAAFDLLVREGDASADEFEKRIYPNDDAGYDSSTAWWDDCVRPVFESLPGVELTNEREGVWTYRQDIGGSASTDSGGEVPDEPVGPADENDG